MHGGSLVFDLALVLGVAALTSPVARWLGQPTILGYLVAGLVVGPYIPIPLFADHTRVESLAELGVVLVMFAVGLELRITKLLKVLPTAGLTGALQVGFLLWCGVTLGGVLGWSNVESVFLGAGIAISSTMVVSRALGSGVDASIREHVLGVLVVQDVLAIVLIAAMTGVATGGVVAPEELARDLLALGGVLLAMIVGGLVVVPRLVRGVAGLGSDEVLIVVGVGACFVLAAIAAGLGYSVALGAFVSGVLVAESGQGERVEHLVAPMRDVFAGIFFVAIGMTVDPRDAWETLPLALGLSTLVIVAQLLVVSASGLVSGLGLRRSVTAGLALGQIGEFAFILAAIGISAGVVRSELQPLLVTVAVLTAFTTPLAIRAAPRVTGFIDRAMPGALRRLLALHEQWFEELRTRAARRADPGPVRRGLRALAVDAVLVLAIAASTAAWMDSAVPALRLWLGIEQGTARVLWLGGALLVMLPVLVFAVRSASAIAGAVTQGSDEGGPQKARSRALRTLLLIGLTALVGFPAATLIDAVTSDARAIAFVLILLAILIVVALRSAREVDANVRSAAGTIAEALVSQQAPAPTPTPTDFGPIDRFEMRAGAAACGRTLAELDLRARTGATVVAIAREGGAAVLPNGREQLQVGHVLALAGTPQAIAAAKEILLGGAILASKEEAPAV